MDWLRLVRCSTKDRETLGASALPVLSDITAFRTIGLHMMRGSGARAPEIQAPFGTTLEPARGRSLEREDSLDGFPSQSLDLRVNTLDS